MSHINWSLDYDGEDFTISVGTLNLVGCQWKPKQKPKFNYIFIHGLAVFGTFHREFFDFILENGGMVFACDHIGHGRSPGSPISCTIEEIVEETSKVIIHANTINPNLPLLLHGHSMGGLSLLSLLLLHSELPQNHLISGLFIESPWVASCPQREPNCCLLNVLRFLNYTIPTFQIEGGVKLVSNDLNQEWCNLLINHPKFSTKMTPRNYISVRDTQDLLKIKLNNWPNNIPTLFIQGGKDDLLTPFEVDTFLKQIINLNPNSQIKYEYFENGPHVLLKSIFREEVIKLILELINKIL